MSQFRYEDDLAFTFLRATDAGTLKPKFFLITGQKFTPISISNFCAEMLPLCCPSSRLRKSQGKKKAQGEDRRFPFSQEKLFLEVVFFFFGTELPPCASLARALVTVCHACVERLPFSRAHERTLEKTCKNVKILARLW